MLLLLTFVNIDKKGFVSHVINKIAASSFAAYLLHHNSVIMEDYYQKICWGFWENHYYGYIPLVLLFVIIVFFASVIIDQIRILCWNKIEPALNKLLTR